ncbi:DUF2513 domain-containing protein [Pseudomonas atacamensis]|uniref:DUF2513 domain-containing protein n=1 Tax=Pseudomonas atacamensis TaxID=2565368 RepID=UPI00382353D7
MPRNPDLIRLLMLELEGLDKSAGSIAMLNYQTDLIIPGYESDAVYYHIDQILQSGWVDTAGGRGLTASGQFSYRALTPKGHDFIDSVRDDAIWALTKKGATAAGGFTLDTLAALGKGLLKKQIERITGIELG